MSVTVHDAFLDPLIVEIVGDGKYKLTGPFRFSADNGDIIYVPSCFLTDFASVPRMFWSIFPPEGPYTKAAVLHDYLLDTKGLGGRYTKKKCDLLFLEAMARSGVGWTTRHTMYNAVRWYAPTFEKAAALKTALHRRKR